MTTNPNPDHSDTDADARDRVIESALGRLLGPSGPPDLTADIAEAMAENRAPRFATTAPHPDEIETGTQTTDHEAAMFERISSETPASRFTWQITWLTLAAAGVMAIVTAVLLQPDTPDRGDDAVFAQDADDANTEPVDGDFRILGREQQANGNRVTVTETRERVVPHLADTAVAALTTNGSITIHRDASRQDVQITIRVQATADDATTAGQLVDEMGASVGRDLTTNGLRVTARLPVRENGDNGNNGDNRQVSFTILMPGATGATAQATNGSVTLLGLGGTAVATSRNGSVTVTKHTGAVQATTTNGTVTVTDVTGDVTANSRNGNVTARGVTGSATLSTTNGTVGCSLADDSTGTFRVTAGNGSASASVGPRFNGAVQLDTNIGSATIRDPGGRISTDGKVGGSRLGASMRLVVGSETGTVNTIRTTNGSVTLTVRE